MLLPIGNLHLICFISQSSLIIMLSQIYIRKTKVVLSLLEIATVVKDI